MRRVGGMFHVPGTRAGWWARCPRILGTHRIRPGRVPHAWDGACPSHASRTRRGRVPRAGDACRMVGTLPPHPGNVQKPSQACGTRPGRCTSQSRVQDAFCTCTRATRPGHVAHARDAFSVFPGCGGSVPTTWHASPARGTRPQRVGRATGTCTVPGVWHTPGTDSTCSQDAGAACPPSGTCPRRVEHAPDASHAYTRLATRN